MGHRWYLESCASDEAKRNDPNGTSILRFKHAQHGSSFLRSKGKLNGENLWNILESQNCERILGFKSIQAWVFHA